MGASASSARAAETPATAPASHNDAFQAQLAAVDERVSKIADLSATFRQEKFTPLLRKPLVSVGEVRVKGDRMLWDTQAPALTLMQITPTDMRIYYPADKIMEIFPIQGKLGALAASPLPRLDLLKQYFRLEPSGNAAPDKKLAVRLTPTDASIAEFVESVQVLIDIDHGWMERFEIVDADGEKTVITFDEIRINSQLPDSALDLTPPRGTRVVRPLQGDETESTQPSDP